MRLFVALDIEAAIRARLADFVAKVRPLAPEARWVGPQSFHITLKFIGERRPDQVEAIKQALAQIQASPIAINFRGTGFFPDPHSARVFWVGIEADPNLAALAESVDRSLARLQVPPEERPFSPHLTLARGGDPRHSRGGSGRPHFNGVPSKPDSGLLGWKPGEKATRCFTVLQENLQRGPQQASGGLAGVEAAPAPEFGVMAAAEFFLYESKLSPAGAQYTKLARFPLRAG
jgi:2'-5' RNA ligase